MASSMKLDVKAEGINETLAAFKKMPKEASKELRVKSKELVGTLTPRIQSAARSDRSPQSKLLGPTVRPKSDRVPAIQTGGAKKIGRNRVPAFKLLFGSEFGSDRYKQFGKPHQGQNGSWFFPVVENESSTISKAWLSAADEVVKKFSN